MRQSLQCIIAVSITAIVAAITISNSASAHVVVKPTEVTTASFQTFTIGVPNEKTSPTTEVKLIMPRGLAHVAPTQKPGWTITVSRNDTTDDTNVTSITWSGGAIEAGFRDDFTFSAQVPATATNLHWKAYQTYAEGGTVAWDKASVDGHQPNVGPFSTTEVVTTAAADLAIRNNEQAAIDATRAADLALYGSVSSLAAGLTALYFSTRRK